jgi:hypothetical protein
MSTVNKIMMVAIFDRIDRGRGILDGPLVFVRK